MTYPATWPEGWRRIAAAIQRSAETGQPVGAVSDLGRAAGFGGKVRPGRKTIIAMQAAGVLVCERGAHITWILPQQNIRSAGALVRSMRRASLQDAVRSAIRDQRPIGAASVIGEAVGMNARAAIVAVRRAIARGLLVRQLRRTADGGEEVRWGVQGVDGMTPWARRGAGMRDTPAHQHQTKQVPQQALPRVDAAVGKPTAPAKIRRLAPLPSTPVAIPQNAGARTSSMLIKEKGRRIALHTARMTRARPQTEDELRALVEAHIRTKGVLRIEVGAAEPGPMPVNGRGRSIGPGHARVGGR